MEIRWGLVWDIWNNSVYGMLYEAVPFEEPYGMLWSMGIAYNTIMHEELVLVDTAKEERIMGNELYRTI